MCLDLISLAMVPCLLYNRKYSVKAIQRQTVVGRRDRDAVLSLPSFGALECRDTHLGCEIPSQMPNVHSASLSLLRQGLRLDRVH